MGKRLVIGLTGGIASGKSMAAQRFAELGVPVIDADQASRAVVAPGTQGLSKVIERFGSSILDAKGELNRFAMRSLIFSDATARADLNAILHPLIRDYMQHEISSSIGPYVVLAIPLLVEGGNARDRVDRVLVVDVEEGVQIRRLAKRDGSTSEQAHAILAAQAKRSARLEAADDVLSNAGTVKELRDAVDRLHDRYLEMARQNQGLP